MTDGTNEEELNEALPASELKRLVKLHYVNKNQIRRLQEQNKLLKETLIDERVCRQQAYRWYQKRLKSRPFWIFDLWYSNILRKNAV